MRTGPEWKDYTLDPIDIITDSYRDMIGGGSAEWEMRGLFQLGFMTEMGLRPHHRLMDIGCGPGLRAGEHFIRYLYSGLYLGFDYNADFIIACYHKLRRSQDLLDKHPRLHKIENFKVIGLVEADFAICLSVLNHLDDKDRTTFFENIQHGMAKGGRLYVTHAFWYNGPGCETRLMETRRIEDVSFVPVSITQKWASELVPIIEFTKS